MPRLSEKNSAIHQSMDKLEPNFLPKLKLVPDFHVGGSQNFMIKWVGSNKERSLIIMQHNWNEMKFIPYPIKGGFNKIKTFGTFQQI